MVRTRTARWPSRDRLPRRLVVRALPGPGAWPVPRWAAVVPACPVRGLVGPGVRGARGGVGHPAPCVDCAGLAGPELGWPGLAWLAARCGVSVEDVMEAATW
jgi:hypothetical protein